MTLIHALRQFSRQARPHMITATLAIMCGAQTGSAEALTTDCDGAGSTNAMSEQEATHTNKVCAAVLDYVDALYEAEPQRIRRSVSPELQKFGVSYNAAGTPRWSTITFDQLVSLAERYNAAGTSMANEPREVDVLAIESRIAAARLTAQWGVDYILLNRDDDGQWRIRHVLWEGRSPASNPTVGGF